MQKKHIVVLGAGLAGFHAALELARALRDHQVTLISREEELLLAPSLALLPFRLRTAHDVSVPVRPLLEAHGVRFARDLAVRLDLDRRTIATRDGGTRYDYLVVATEARPSYAAVPGLGPSGYTHSITCLREAEQTRAAYERFLEAPGPIVVGALANGVGYVPAHDFLFTLAGQLRQRGLAGRIPMTYLTSASDVAHLGTSGLASAVHMDEHILAELGVQTITDATVRGISPGKIQLIDGRTVPFAFGLIMPPFLGADVVRPCEAITNGSGFVQIDESFRTAAYPEVFAVGAASAGVGDPRSCDPWDADRSSGTFERAGATIAAAIAHDLAAGADARAGVENTNAAQI